MLAHAVSASQEPCSSQTEAAAPAAAVSALSTRGSLSRASLSMVMCEDFGAALCSSDFGDASERSGADDESSAAEAGGRAKKLRSSEGGPSAVLLSQFSLSPSSLAGVHAHVHAELGLCE